MFKLLFPLLILACQLSYCQYFDVGFDGVKLKSHQQFSKNKKNIFDQDSSVYFLVNNKFVWDTTKSKTSQFLLEFGKNDLNLKRRIDLYSSGKQLYEIQFCKSGIVAVYYEYLNRKTIKRFIGFVPNGKNQVEDIVETKNNTKLDTYKKWWWGGKIIPYVINSLQKNPSGGYFLIGYNQLYKISESLDISDSDTNEYKRITKQDFINKISANAFENYHYNTVGYPKVGASKKNYFVRSYAGKRQYEIELNQKINFRKDLSTHIRVSENLYNAKNDSFEIVLDSIKFVGLNKRNFFSSFYTSGVEKNIYLIDLYSVKEDKEKFIGSNIYQIDLKDKTINLKTSNKILVDGKNIVHDYLFNTIKKEFRLNQRCALASSEKEYFEKFYKIPNGETALVFSFGNVARKSGTAPGFYSIFFDEDMNISKILYSNQLQNNYENYGNYNVLDGVVDNGVYVIHREEKVNEKVFNNPSKIKNPIMFEGGLYFSLISDNPRRIKLMDSKNADYEIYDETIKVIEDGKIVYYLPLIKKDENRIFLGKLEINKLYQEAKSFSFK